MTLYYCCMKSIIDDTAKERLIAVCTDERDAERTMLDLDWDWGEDDRNDYEYYVRRVDENNEEEVAYINPWEDEPEDEDWGYNEDEGFNPYSGCYDFDC